MLKDWKSMVLAKAEVWLSRHQTPLLLKELGWNGIRFVIKCGKSNPISFALRPLALNKHLRAVIGFNLVVLVLAVALWSPTPLLAENTGGVETLAIATGGEIKMSTLQAIKMPLTNYTMSQKFWLLHSGIDMAAVVGEPIHPISDGKVVFVEKGWFGYGNHVIVRHSADYESLYAHMSKVLVKEGQEVNTNTILGEVGSTGHSTGPHLHLEIRQNGQVINPAPILGI